MMATLQNNRFARRVARTGVGRFVRRAASFLLYRVVYRRDQAMRIRAGSNFANRSARRYPIIVIVASDMQKGDAERLASEVEGAQLAVRSFRPLFVIDTAEFAPFRRRGYVVERVMRAEELATVKPDDVHSAYVDSRLDGIVRRYGASSLLMVTHSDLGGVQQKLLNVSAQPEGAS